MSHPSPSHTHMLLMVILMSTSARQSFSFCLSMFVASFVGTKALWHCLSLLDLKKKSFYLIPILFHPFIFETKEQYFGIFVNICSCFGVSLWHLSPCLSSCHIKTSLCFILYPTCVKILEFLQPASGTGKRFLCFSQEISKIWRRLASRTINSDVILDQITLSTWGERVIPLQQQKTHKRWMCYDY